MNSREMIEKNEEYYLSEYATKSINSRGRENKENESPLRTCFQTDLTRIVNSHPFKREKFKTQVFILPKNDHIMDRLTHTLEVTNVARIISSSLRLNSDLTEAIAMGHDTAHTCFGHAGERALNKLADNGYSHAKESYRRLNILSGMNLTYEVLDGIANHSGLSNNPKAQTLEGKIVNHADKIAYLTSDAENAISMGIIKDIPDKVKKKLGSTKTEIVDNLISSIVRASLNQPYIKMEDDFYEAFVEFREFNFNEIYYNKRLQEGNKKAELVIEYLYDYFIKHPESLPEVSEPDNLKQSVIDYIAGMTDKYAMNMFSDFTNL